MFDVILVILAVLVWFGLMALFIGSVLYCIHLVNQMDPVGAANEIADRLYRAGRSR